MRFHIIILILISVLASFKSATALETNQKVLYLGFAGNGPGQGAFGHAFIVFSDRPGDFFRSVAYQYNLVVPTGFNIGPTNFFKLESYPFMVLKAPGYSFIKYYTDQNRAVYLFEAKFPPNVVTEIQQKLETDMLARQQHKHTDYRVMSNNCDTEVYDLLNKYLPPTERLKYVPIEEIPLDYLFVGRKRIAISVPLSAPLVLKQNSFFPKEFYFKPIEIEKFEQILEQVKLVKSLVKDCSVRADMANFIVRLSSNPKTSSSRAYVDLLWRQFGAYALNDPAIANDFVNLLDTVRYSAAPPVALEIDRVMRRIGQ